jgi:hypothetical protein
VYLSESEIHFRKWIYPKKQKGMALIFLISALLHVTLIVVYFFSTKQQEITSASKEESQVHVTLIPPKKAIAKSQQQETNQATPSTKKENHKILLTDENLRSKSPIMAPNRHHRQDLSSFMPHSNSDFIRGLRKEAQDPTDFQAADGDIPIVGKSTSPIQSAKIQDRHSVKDLSLFQFSAEFRNRFGAIWNEQDRVVPPASPLRPGDVVFYKVYINDDGTLNKYENISAKRFSQKDFSHLDVIFSSVIGKVFPMMIPPRFAHQGKIITEIVAIQVVDRSLPMQFSF